MACKYELDPTKPASDQIQKTVFNNEKQYVSIAYHYE